MDKDANTEQIRSLDVKPYRLIVAVNQFGMRGIDYRSKQVAITLVIAQPFENKREAMQGFARVGRFGDKYKRVLFDDVQVIDSRSEMLYTAKLLRHISTLTKKQILLKPIIVKPAQKQAVPKNMGGKQSQKRTNMLLGDNLPKGQRSAADMFKQQLVKD